jgi:hypothetical protein
MNLKDLKENWCEKTQFDSDLDERLDCVNQTKN